MATKYATLKDSNGDTIYPQISTDSITDGSITSSKIDWSTVSANSDYHSTFLYNDFTGNSKQLLSFNYTSVTGRVAIVAYTSTYIPSNSVYTHIKINGVTKTTVPMNNRQYLGPAIAMWTGDIGTSSVTVSLELEGQSGVEFVVPAFKPHSVMIFDIR